MPAQDDRALDADDEVQVYLSYSHRDRRLLDEFRAAVRQAGLPVRLFHDQDLAAGEAWEEALRRGLEASRIVLFFLSADALGAHHIWETEVPTAIAMQKQGRAIVVPLLLRACDWTTTPLAAYQLLPRDLNPIADARPRARAWLAVTEELRRLVDMLLQRQTGRESRQRPPDLNRPMPPGADRLRLALYAVLEQPAELELLDRLDESELAALWQRLSSDGRPMAEVLQSLSRQHGDVAPQPLWAAWIETVHPDKLDP